LNRSYREARDQANALQDQYREVTEENKSLAARLRQKEDDLTRREKEISAKERELQNRETEAESRDKKIATLERDLAKKEDRSLFGIRLNYQRILFLFDRSGSIVQNNWKEVIVGTCREILQNCDVEEFAIVAFSSEMLFYPPSRGLMYAGSTENKQKAIQWLDRDLLFGGSTHIHEALKIAYEEYGKLDAIFLVTDGLPSAQNRTPESIQREIIRYIEAQVRKKVETRVITIAIGYPPADAQQYADIYKYLHEISNLTKGQYLGR
jgi:hypothetical protein